METQRGLVKLIILIIIAIVIISLFGISLRDLKEEGTITDNFTFTKQVIVDTWNNYLKKPFIWVWDFFIRPFIINPIDNWVDNENTAQLGRLMTHL